MYMYMRENSPQPERENKYVYVKGVVNVPFGKHYVEM